MYSYLASRLLLCCPQSASLLIPLRRNEYQTYNDDEYEKYEPRPKIIIDPEIDSISCASERNSVSLSSDSGPVLIVTVQYSPQKRAVIAKVTSLLNMGKSTDDENFSIRVVVDCCKNSKQQTSYVASNRQMCFNETFSYSQIEEASIRECGIKFRVYSRKGRTRGTLRGETCISGESISFNGPAQHKLYLNKIETLKSEITTGLSPSMHRMSNGSFANGDSRRSSMVDACGRFCSQPNAESPELLMSLSYDQDQNCVTIVVEKGSQIGDKHKPPDTFIKMSATSGEFGNEFWRSKTEICKGCSEPQYDYAATVQLSRNTIDQTTVKIEVWQSIGMLRRRCQLGYVAVGLNASSPDAQEHWEQMVQGQGIAVSKWHPMQPPEH